MKLKHTLFKYKSDNCSFELKFSHVKGLFSRLTCRHNLSCKRRRYNHPYSHLQTDKLKKLTKLKRRRNNLVWYLKKRSQGN